MEKTKVIDGRTFSFGFIPPEEAIDVHVAVAKVVGEPLFKAFMDPKKTGGTEADAEQAGTAAIALMLSKMNSADLKAAMHSVFKYTNCEDQRVDMNATFVGKPGAMYKVFVAGLAYNFSDFLPEGLFDSLRQKLAV